MSEEFSFEQKKEQPVGNDLFQADMPPILANDHRIRPVQAQVYQTQLETPLQTLFDSVKSATGRTEAYGAPRVFDLFTLLAITLAFALLFALLGLLAPAMDASASDLTLVISSFVTLIGVSQMWMFGSKNPRMASLVAGPFALMIVMGIPMFRYNNWELAFFSALCFSIFFGSFAGYLGGAVVAGVFLLADKFRSKFMVQGAEQRDASFDELQ